MDEQEKSELISRINRKFVKLEKKIWDLEQRSLTFKVKKYWNQLLSVLFVFLSSAEGNTVWSRFAMMVSTIYKFVRSGFKLEDEQKQVARLEICKTCPDFVPSTTQCKQCGCIMSRKVKISEASCPLKKW